jgi:hypothetical protein
VKAHTYFMLVQVEFHEGLVDQRLEIPTGNQKSHFDPRRLLNDPAWTSTRGFGGLR